MFDDRPGRPRRGGHRGRATPSLTNSGGWWRGGRADRDARDGDRPPRFRLARAPMLIFVFCRAESCLRPAEVVNWTRRARDRGGGRVRAEIPGSFLTQPDGLPRAGRRRRRPHSFLRTIEGESHVREQSPSATGKAVPPKKGVSPVRNAIGLVVLIAVVVVGVLRSTSAMASFNSAVNALNDRMADEDKDLMTQSEAETLIGKPPDDAGSDFQLGSATYTKKTYTWKGTDQALHADGVLHQGERSRPPPHRDRGCEVRARDECRAGTVRDQREGRRARAGDAEVGRREEIRWTARTRGRQRREEAPKDQEKPQADDKAKAGADEKAKDAEPKPDDKAKAGAGRAPEAARIGERNGEAGVDPQPVRRASPGRSGICADGSSSCPNLLRRTSASRLSRPPAGRAAAILL